MRSSARHNVAGTALAALAGLSILCTATAATADVNIYSYRQEALIKPQLDAFTKATGIRYNLISGDASGLIERIRAEGENTPADVLLTVDAGHLSRAKQLGITQAVRSDVLEKNIPAHYRDPQGHWFGLGIRVRTVYYHVDRVKPAQLSTYEDLADPKWKGKLLIRSSNNIYNQSLLASMIHYHKVKGAEDWARGMVANFARKPQGGDTEQITAVAAGEGDIAVANNYYYARLAASTKEADRKVVAKVKPFFPNQQGRGAHVNVSGGLVTKAAKHRAEAVKLLEFLVGEEAQKIYAEVGQEMPVRPGVPLSPTLIAMGMKDIKLDDLGLHVLGDNNAEAIRIFDRVGWR